MNSQTSLSSRRNALRWILIVASAPVVVSASVGILVPGVLLSEPPYPSRDETLLASLILLGYGLSLGVAGSLSESRLPRGVRWTVAFATCSLSIYLVWVHRLFSGLCVVVASAIAVWLLLRRRQ